MHPRTKVLYLITKSNWGGAQRYVYDLATSLDSTKFEAVVALGGQGTLVELLTHAGVKVITIETLSRDISITKEWSFAKELWEILRVERPDILHVNSSKAGGVGTLLGRLARVQRVLFTAHGWAFNEDRPALQRFIIKVLHWLTVLFSHKTIAVSHAILTQMNWPLVSKKMKVINPGRTIGVMYEAKEARGKIIDFFPRLAPHIEKTWIITIAELHPIKRLPILIDAMKEAIKTHPRLVCVIIGDGQEKNHLRHLIESNNLNDHVFLVGAITEAARFLKAGDIFALPSRSESYGYVLHEAALARVPIIATRVGGIIDIIKNSDEGLLVPPDDVRALTQAITETLFDTTATANRVARLYEKMHLRSTGQMVLATTALYELPLR